MGRYHGKATVFVFGYVSIPHDRFVIVLCLTLQRSHARKEFLAVMNRRPTKKPRGAYSLGGCGTCRRRHVKCDKVRPHCLTCQAVGASCDGFQYVGIKWITNEDPELQSNGVSEISARKSRRALYPGWCCLCNTSSKLTSLRQCNHRPQ